MRPHIKKRKEKKKTTTSTVYSLDWLLMINVSTNRWLVLYTFVLGIYLDFYFKSDPHRMITTLPAPNIMFRYLQKSEEMDLL